MELESYDTQGRPGRSSKEPARPTILSGFIFYLESTTLFVCTGSSEQQNKLLLLVDLAHGPLESKLTQ